MSFKYDLSFLKTRDQLLHFLAVDEESFESILSFDPKKTFEDYMQDGSPAIGAPMFMKHQIPKKNRARGYRVVWEPMHLMSQYKALARRLNLHFSNKMEHFPHQRVFGYVPGRNIRENASDHCGHKRLASIDIKDFFPSISSVRIADLLKKAGMMPGVSELVSRFVSIGGELPLGLPTSPVISNAICLEMDVELADLAGRIGATYSRYADDITFSHEDEPPLAEIIGCVRRHGFEIAEDKTRRSKLGQAHYVTGLSVSDPERPHIPREKKRRLRQELYYAQKHGLDGHFNRLGIYDPRLIQHEVNRLDGFVKFTVHHEPQLANLKDRWAEILRQSGHTPSFRPKNQDRKPFSIYVDEAEYLRPDGVRFLALAMSTSQNQEQVDRATLKVLESNLSDIWAAGDKQVVLKKGLHYSDATQDTRLAYLECLRSLPFEGYVAIGRLDNPSEYEGTYIRLLESMIKRRLMAAESQLACLMFEQNNKVRQDLIRQTVSSTHALLRTTKNRHPEACIVSFCSKPTLGLSVPDFLLGTLGRYLSSEPSPAGKPLPRDVLLFERIRDKYRLILDVDDWVEYSRRRPVAPWHAQGK